jgi:hypothetical protein
MRWRVVDVSVLAAIRPMIWWPSSPHAWTDAVSVGMARATAAMATGTFDIG